MCCPDVSPTSAFLVGLMCLTAFSNFAKTSADFSGRGEAPIPSCAGRLLMDGSSDIIRVLRSSSGKVDVSRSGIVMWGVILIFLK